MDDAVRVLRTSVDAEGSALAEHEKWMDSIQAKQQQFEAQYQAFANAFVNSELIKGVYDTGTGMLGWLTKLVETLVCGGSVRITWNGGTISNVNRCF